MAIENFHIYLIYPLNMLMFCGYVSLPEGNGWEKRIPTGMHTENYRKSQCFMEKSTINGHVQ